MLSAFGLPCSFFVLFRLQLSVLVFTAGMIAHSRRHFPGASLGRPPHEPDLFPAVCFRSLALIAQRAFADTHLGSFVALTTTLLVHATIPTQLVTSLQRRQLCGTS